MAKKYIVLVCITISVTLLVVAASLYPGGSLADGHSTGFDWSRNFISNLFGRKAMNGLENPSRSWAIIGMAFFSVGEGVFLINTAKKIGHAASFEILASIAVINIMFTFLVASPLHDIMVTVSSTLSLVGLFYITVFILKTKLHFLKFCCIICLLTFYYTLFLYGSGNWGLLAIMQKLSLISLMLLMLAIEFFTNAEDFKAIKPGKKPFREPATNMQTIATADDPVQRRERTS